jgi:hypothetical protein
VDDLAVHFATVFVAESEDRRQRSGVGGGGHWGGLLYSGHWGSDQYPISNDQGMTRFQ